MKARVSGEVGTRLELGGQEYQLVRLDPYVTAAGREVTLTVWQTSCAVCGTTFEAKQKIGSIELNRRCRAHRAAGVRVRKTSTEYAARH